MKDKSYFDRLKKLEILTLEGRRIYFDLIFFFKIIKKLVIISIDDYIIFNDLPTRGHKFKLKVQYSKNNVRKFFFLNRIIPIWNDLPDVVVESKDLENFKQYIHKIDFSTYCQGSFFSEI